MSLAELSDARFELAGGWLPGHTDPDYFPIEGTHLDTHQGEMWKALSRGASCILNSNPTGAGKTLSWAAPVIRREPSSPSLVLATYPTGALLEDQRETLLTYLRKYFRAESDPWASETSYKLVERSDGDPDRITNGDRTLPLTDLVSTVSATVNPNTSSGQQINAAVESLLAADEESLPGIVLSTPDTLTLLATNRFRSGDVDRLVPMLDAIVVDEFHLATDRARRLLPFHLDHYRTLSGRYLESFVFLSATPHPSYVRRLERAFDPTNVKNEVMSQPTGTESARQILPETTLGVTCQRQFTSGRWLANNVDVLAEAYQPPGQLLVIVDSVREVEQVAEAFGRETDLAVGRVYGWKRERRQAAIRESDVVVGNTAVEVGVDFRRVNRLVCTGYEPASTLQRIGRMRHRSEYDDYSALLITSPAIQRVLASTATEGTLDRVEFDEALHETDRGIGRPFYDILCGMYARYLWDKDEKPLTEEYAMKGAEYREVASNHFSQDFAEFFGECPGPEVFWEQTGELIAEQPTEAIFDELHGYRPSSLSCVVLDTMDSDERVKTYNLAHVLRYRRGEVVALDTIRERFGTVFGESPDKSERAVLDRGAEHSVAGFVSEGRRNRARCYYLKDFSGLWELERIADEGAPHQAIRTLPGPQIRTNPAIEGLENVDLSDESVLVQYVRSDPRTARQRFHLGPYAAVVPTTGDGSLLLWDDAIKAHCQLVSEARGQDR